MNGLHKNHKITSSNKLYLFNIYFKLENIKINIAAKTIIHLIECQNHKLLALHLKKCIKIDNCGVDVIKFFNRITCSTRLTSQ